MRTPQHSKPLIYWGSLEGMCFQVMEMLFQWQKYDLGEGNPNIYSSLIV